jgi:hypothetical protein
LNRLSPKTEEAICTYGGKPFEVSRGLKRKKKEILFVLGSGQSINNFEQHHWDHIDSYDSIGINDFIRFGYEPTFHSMETEKQSQQIFRERWEASFRSIKYILESKGKTQFIIRPDTANSGLITNILKQLLEHNRLYWSNYHILPGMSRKELGLFIKAYDFLGLLNNSWCFLNRGSSLSWIMSFAYKLGYSKVVLCGIDLHGDHFFNTDAKLVTVPDDKKLHFTADSTRNAVTIVDVIKAWRPTYNRNNQEIYVSTRFSLLKDDLKVYFDDI